MAKEKGSFVKQIDENELGNVVRECGKQTEDPKNAEVSSLLVIYSGIDEQNNGLICGHSLANPSTVAIALVNEALLFGRHDEVLELIYVTRKIINSAEHTIRAELAKKSQSN